MLIDDESTSLEVLSGLIAAYCPEIRILATFSDPLEGMKALPELQPDLLFLDVQMPVINGLEVLNIIGADRCAVIFVTAHQEFAIKALKLLATDYLLKPVDPDELSAAVERAKKRNVKGVPIKVPEEKPDQYIRVPNSEGFEIIHIPDIVRVEADNSYSTLVLNTGRSVIISKGIREFEPLLTVHPLVRVHRSHIINLSHLQSYSGTEGGWVLLTNGEQVPVSRRRVKDLKEKLDQWSIKLG